MDAAASVLELEYDGRLAIVTINNRSKLNALDQQQFYDLAQKLREIATHDEVIITLLIGRGRFFSAGADISMGNKPVGPDVHRHFLTGFVAHNLNITQAFYTHPKILVVGLNGPVVGLSAALVATADFIYASPHAFLLTPFSSLGLVAEGGASRALVQRLGIARANEALIQSRRLGIEDLVATGFVNRVLACREGEDDRFRALVLQEIDERMGAHLVAGSMLAIKALIRRPEREVMDRHNVAEVFAGLDRFVSGVPMEEFRKLASGEKRHKL